MKRINLLSLLILNFLFAKGQNINLNGIAIDEDNNPVPYSTVLLNFSSDSSLYKGEITNEEGKFVFQNVKPGNYYLQAQYVGLTSALISGIIINENNDLVLEPIILRHNSNQIDAVTIVGEKPFIERIADKTVVNIENSIIHTGSSIMEIMEKLPGVLVDQDGN